MKFNREIHRRRSIRLRGYDYSKDGFYFITLCTRERVMLFGDIIKENGCFQKMVCNELGKIVAEEWVRSSSIRKEIRIDDFVVMPNHLHGIICIRGRGDRPVAPTRDRPGPKPKSVSSFIAGFKSAATLRVNQTRQSPGTAVWQRNYYEHIIRNKAELEKTREYIHTNALNWETDENNLVNVHEK
jgi:putative transposase